MNNMQSITARNVGYTIAGREILTSVDVRCVRGRTLALVGESGCGKTTMLDILGLLVRPSRGELTVGRERANRWSSSRRRKFWRDDAAFIFQDYGLVEHESVLYNITLHKSLLGRRHETISPRLKRVLQSLRLERHVYDDVEVLSGGERQRVGIARALWKHAKFVFADEPTASLDAGNRQIVRDLLFSLADAGAAVIISTHDAALSEVCDVSIDLTDL